MRKKVTLVIAILALLVGGLYALSISSAERIPEKNGVLIKEYIDSFLDWETIIARLPNLEGYYEVEEIISVRGDMKAKIRIRPDSPLLWMSNRGVIACESEPYRIFEVQIALFESKGLLKKQIDVIPLAGFEVWEDEVTVGFFEEITHEGFINLQAFAAKDRLWIRFVIKTEAGAEPFAERAELEELIDLVKEMLLEFNI